MAKKARRGRGRGRGLAAVSVETLRAELQRRERGVSGLRRRYEKLLAAAEKIAGQIRSAGGDLVGAPAREGRRGPGRPPGSGRRGPGRPRGSGGRRRPKNEMNLVESLAKVLKGKTMSVTEVADAVQKEGYKTTSANFRTIVNQTLIKSPAFRKVGRGQYTAK